MALKVNIDFFHLPSQLERNCEEPVFTLVGLEYNFNFETYNLFLPHLVREEQQFCGS